MKKTLIFTLFLSGLLVHAACKKDDQDPPPPSSNNNPDVSFQAIISGDIVDTLSFTIPGAIVTDYSVVATYSGAIGILNMSVMKLPAEYQFGLNGTRDSFALGDFEGSEMMGYGSYTDAGLGRQFLATQSTITISSIETAQSVVNATYWANGSFSATMESTDSSPSIIQVEGSFENITLHVNE